MKKTITLLLLFTTSVFFSQVPNYVPTNGLVGWWPFTGNANDLSGNGNNGTNNGATLTTDRFGNLNNAYNFDGNNDFVSVPRNNISNFSVSLWLHTNINTEFSALVDANVSNWELYLKNLKPTFTKWILAPGNYQELISTTTLPLSQWHHLTYTYSSNNVNIYLNGLLISSFNNINLTNLNSGLYYFGASISGSSQFYSGKIDDIGIWNRALTQQEITNLYNASLSTEDFAINTIDIYPNPTTTFLNFKTSIQVEKILIYNMLGQLVQQEKVNALEGTINIEKLAQGTYLVKVNDIDKGYTIIKN